MGRVIGFRAGMLVGCALMALASPALAQDDDAAAPMASAETEASDEDIVVTGTKIRGVGPVGSSVVTLGRDDIEVAGADTTTELLRQVPQVFAFGSDEGSRVVSNQGAGLNRTMGSGLNLRGVGASATLILLNGHRLPASGLVLDYIDAGAIPTGVVERVEVIADGASAIYGSDAVAGVVNFITRRGNGGGETQGRRGFADGYDTWQASHVQGLDWGSGDLIAAVEYQGHSNLNAADRAFYTQDLRAFGGADRRTNFAAPGNILVGTTSYALPPGDGRNLTPAQLTAGTSNRLDQFAVQDILPEQERWTGFLAGRQSLGEAVTIAFDAYYTKRDYTFLEAAQTGALVVPSSNPFFVSPVPGAATVNVNYSFVRDIGPRISQGHSKSYQATVAPSFELGGGWVLDLGSTLAWDFELYGQRGDVRTALLNAALADTNPATAFNPFGSGGQNNPATIAGFRGYQDNESRFRMRHYSARLNGSLLDLPGGAARIAVGAEYREDDYRYVQSGNLTTATPTVFNTLRGARDVKSGFAELFVPLFGAGNAVPGLERLELSGAVRVEDYSDFGTTTNPKLGVNWSPFPGVKLRGTYGTSFRAPTLADLNPGFGGGGVIGGVFTDPASPTGQVQAITIRGGNPNLGPEKAKTWSFGFDWTPEFAKGLSLSAGYFILDYRDIVGGLAGNASVFVQEALMPPGAIVRNPTLAEVQAVLAANTVVGTINPALVRAIIDGRRRNLARLRYEGLDFTASHAFELGASEFTLWTAGTIYTSVQTADTPLAPLRDVKGLINYPPGFRARAGAGWKLDGLRANAVVNHVGAYDNNLVTPVQRVKSFTTLDLNLSYTTPEGPVWGGLTFELDVQNVFDRGPPFVNNVAGYGYDSQVHSALGRVLTLALRKKW